MKKHHHDKDILRIANFMNDFLGFEMLEDIPCPDHLQSDYEDLDAEGKRQWYEYTLNEVFRIADMESICVLGREPNVVELDTTLQAFIRRDKGIYRLNKLKGDKSINSAEIKHSPNLILNWINQLEKLKEKLKAIEDKQGLFEFTPDKDLPDLLHPNR